MNCKWRVCCCIGMWDEEEIVSVDVIINKVPAAFLLQELYCIHYWNLRYSIS